MSELTETIKVSKQVKDALDKLKQEGGHSSYDSALRDVLPMKKKGKKKGD
jgi:predicted CopG family antitoxin